tara:strand:- start:233 stop:436 length:204 start_codon:yes stop_codon:yes gene_type:complete
MKEQYNKEDILTIENINNHFDKWNELKKKKAKENQIKKSKGSEEISLEEVKKAFPWNKGINDLLKGE